MITMVRRIRMLSLALVLVAGASAARDQFGVFAQHLVEADEPERETRHRERSVAIQSDDPRVAIADATLPAELASLPGDVRRGDQGNVLSSSSPLGGDPLLASAAVAPVLPPVAPVQGATPDAQVTTVVSSVGGERVSIPSFDEAAHDIIPSTEVARVLFDGIKVLYIEEAADKLRSRSGVVDTADALKSSYRYLVQYLLSSTLCEEEACQRKAFTGLRLMHTSQLTSLVLQGGGGGSDERLSAQDAASELVRYCIATYAGDRADSLGTEAEKDAKASPRLEVLVVTLKQLAAHLLVRLQPFVVYAQWSQADVRAVSIAVLARMAPRFRDIILPKPVAGVPGVERYVAIPLSEYLPLLEGTPGNEGILPAVVREYGVENSVPGQMLRKSRVAGVLASHFPSEEVAFYIRERVWGTLHRLRAQYLSGEPGASGGVVQKLLELVQSQMITLMGGDDLAKTFVATVLTQQIAPEEKYYESRSTVPRAARTDGGKVGAAGGTRERSYPEVLCYRVGKLLSKELKGRDLFHSAAKKKTISEKAMALKLRAKERASVLGAGVEKGLSSLKGLKSKLSELTLRKAAAKELAVDTSKPSFAKRFADWRAARKEAEKKAEALTASTYFFEQTHIDFFYYLLVYAVLAAEAYGGGDASLVGADGLSLSRGGVVGTGGVPQSREGLEGGGGGLDDAEFSVRTTKHDLSEPLKQLERRVVKLQSTRLADLRNPHEIGDRVTGTLESVTGLLQKIPSFLSTMNYDIQRRIAQEQERLKEVTKAGEELVRNVVDYSSGLLKTWSTGVRDLLSSGAVRSALSSAGALATVTGNGAFAPLESTATTSNQFVKSLNEQYDKIDTLLRKPAAAFKVGDTHTSGE